MSFSPQTLLLVVLVFLATSLVVRRGMLRTSSPEPVSSHRSHMNVSHRRPSVRQLRDMMPEIIVKNTAVLDPPFLLSKDHQDVKELPTIADVHGKTTGVIAIDADSADRGLIAADKYAAFMKKVQANVTHFMPLLLRPTFWSLLKAEHPRLLYLHQTLADEFADDLIHVAEKQIKRSQVIVKPSDDGLFSNKKLQLEGIDPVRTSHGMFITDWEEWTLPATISLRLRAARMVGVPEENIEATQILRYQEGQFYKSHLDAFDEWDRANMDRGGQRIATMLTWLNDVPEGLGGDTSFPLAGIKISPRKGDSVLFYDVDRKMALDKFAEHGGEPPRNGTVKWCAVLWIHPRRFD
jgi:prolyl 4-hydroxylase